LIAGDLILAINGTITEGLDLQGAVAAIRGPVGSIVTLAINRNGAIFSVSIVRG
jgi:carboxyl-terminal processing protease